MGWASEVRGGAPSYPTPPSAPTTQPIHATCVDAPLGARRIVVLGAARRRVLTCVRPLMRRVSCRGPGWEAADRVQIKAASSRYGVAHWLSRPRLSTVAPSLSCDPPTPRQPRGRDGVYTAATGARYTPPLANSAQTIRAILLASATRTSRGGLRASMRPSHDPAGTPLRAAQRATALAPMISKRRSERSPILEVRPSRSLPPLER